MRTALDALNNLLAISGESPEGEAVGKARQAISEALREIVQMHDWSYYKRIGRVNTVVSYSTGTITYTHTGGTYERLVTLASGTWPSWAASGIIKISNIEYEVDERRSDSLITLKSGTNPGANVAAGTTYAIYQQSYDLDADFRAAAEITVLSQNRPLEYLNPREFLSRQSLNLNAGQPTHYTFIGSEDTLGRMAILFYPFPDAIYRVDLLYYALPREITTWEYETGSVTTTSGSATITGNSTAFSSRMVGSVLRWSGTANDEPTALDGSYPHDQEVRILERVTATSLRVSATADNTRTSVLYKISDPIDVEEGAMWNLLMRIAEKQFAIMRRLKGLDQFYKNVDRAYENAAQADCRDNTMRRLGYGGSRRVSIRAMPIGS